MENLCKGKNEGISGEREYECIHTHSLKHTLSFAHSQEQHKVVLFCVREPLCMCLHSCMHSLCFFPFLKRTKPALGHLINLDIHLNTLRFIKFFPLFFSICDQMPGIVCSQYPEFHTCYMLNKSAVYSFQTLLRI